MYSQANFIEEPHLQRKAIKDVLEQGGEVTMVPVGTGVCGGVLLQYPNDVHLIFKPPDPYWIQNVAEPHLMEEHAYTLSELLGWHIVPGCMIGQCSEWEDLSDPYDILCEIMAGEWQANSYLTEWVDALMEEYPDAEADDLIDEGFMDLWAEHQAYLDECEGSYHYVIPHEYSSLSNAVKLTELVSFVRMKVMDLTFGNSDRHSGNYILQTQPTIKLWAIDNTRLFGYHPSVNETYLNTILSRYSNNGRESRRFAQIADSAVMDILDNAEGIGRILGGYKSNQVIATANVLHKILLHTLDCTSTSSSTEGITTILGEYVFDATPQEIERWIEQGWGKEGCTCFRCDLIKQYKEKFNEN